MKISLLLIGAIILSGYSLLGQDTKVVKAPEPTYKTAVGVRFFPFAISLKLKSDYKKSAIEFNGYFRDGFTLGGLYEWHFDINKAHNLKAYVGPGAHIGFLKESAGGGALVGIDAVIGLDYKFLRLPINLSLDWQPSYQFGRGDEFRGWGGIGARFTL